MNALRLTAFCLLALSVYPAAAQQDSIATSIGAAVYEGGFLCASLPAEIRKGQRVVLVRPRAPQSWSTAEVTSVDTSSCALGSHAVAGPYAELVSTESPPAAGEPLIAFVTDESPSLQEGRVFVDVGGDRAMELRICTSSEGMHLTAWLGAPLSGDLVWREYFYLGYDVEATCREADYGG